jgi:hypothetical protein
MLLLARCAWCLRPWHTLLLLLLVEGVHIWVAGQRLPGLLLLLCDTTPACFHDRIRDLKPTTAAETTLTLFLPRRLLLLQV